MVSFCGNERFCGDSAKGKVSIAIFFFIISNQVDRLE